MYLTKYTVVYNILSEVEQEYSFLLEVDMVYHDLGETETCYGLVRIPSRFLKF